ncbi:MAG: rhodanese-like domain-containing protein [Paracoccaceae bacterium]|nr:rhodanese-like domain-containing protein [Paracoccaceae bacterium]
MYRALVTCCFLFLAPLVHAMPALVDSQWVEANANDQAIVVLDIQEPANYRRFHLPRSVNAPYEKWRTQGPKVPNGMLPPVGYLEGLLGKLGITIDSKVLIVPTGLAAGEMAAAARVYWTLKTLGHEQVAILNGAWPPMPGSLAWVA